MNQVPIAQAIQENKNNPQRVEKLKLVEPILKFAQTDVHLTPKNSYQKYVELKSPYVSWVVQASQKRSLILKTWWFPFIGDQPYLGFFNKEDAMQERESLLKENYDVSVRGVKAFSLLGYYPDPIYSSMIDDVSTPSFIEMLLHESVHRTIYIKDHFAFNENLANFIARKSTELFLKKHPEIGVDVNLYAEKYNKNVVVQEKFNHFLLNTKQDLENFYAETSKNSKYKEESEFLKLRQEKFDEISQKYLTYMNSKEKGSDYEYAFLKGKFNNAVVLSYAVYEEDQKPLEDVFMKCKGNLGLMIDGLKKCFSDTSSSETEKLGSTLVRCFP
jgi:predicted aminopeptidase